MSNTVQNLRPYRFPQFINTRHYCAINCNVNSTGKFSTLSPRSLAGQRALFPPNRELRDYWVHYAFEVGAQRHGRTILGATQHLHLLYRAA